MRKERWFAAALVVSALGLGVLAGCGGGEKAPDTASPGATTPSAETPAAGTETSTATGAAGEATMALGETVVKERCVLCHGDNGKGDGPGGAALNPKPRDWTDKAYMGNQTDDQLYDVIYNGKGSMPAWGKTGILTETEIRSAIMKVRTYSS